MKVKRFFAATMSAALKQVRETMGDDAVILSSRRVDGGSGTAEAHMQFAIK